MTYPPVHSDRFFLSAARAKRRIMAFAALAVCSWGASWAGDAAPGAGLPEVLVSAERPGPALWRVSAGDHVLWVLGTVPVLPKHQQWSDEQVERVLAGSQVLLGFPGVRPDADIGVLSMFRILPSLFGVEELPAGATLQQVLKADVYARWIEARQKYLGDSQHFERLRPFIAADKLNARAYESAGLADESAIDSALHKLAKQHHVRVVDTDYRLFIKDPKGFIRDFKRASFDESSCFSYQLDELEHTLNTALSQANAWSVGDVSTLQSIQAQEQQDPCWGTLGDSPLSKDLGVDNLQASANEAWLQAAETALAAHEQSFALLEMSDVLEPDGLLSLLQARGYQVQAPDQKPKGPASH